MVDFGEVVVFAGQPKDRGMGTTGLGCGARTGQGGCGFERSKEGSTEESNLLPGDDNSGACG